MEVTTGRLRATDGTRLWYERRTGPAAPVGSDSVRPAQVLVLGAPGGRNAAYWPEPWVDRFVAEGWCVVRFDWRDQGRSDWCAGSAVEHAAETMVGDLDLLCDAVSCDAVSGAPQAEIHLVGVGFGGWVAARLAQRRRAGAAVASLTLSGTSLWYADPSVAGPSEPAVVSLVLRRRGGGAAALHRAMTRELAVECGTVGAVQGEGLTEQVRRWLDHGFNPYDGHRAAWLAAPALDGSLRNLARRVTVLHGAVDPVVPPVHGVRLAERLGVAATFIPGGGHHLDAAMAEALEAVIGRPPT